MLNHIYPEPNSSPKTYEVPTDCQPLEHQLEITHQIECSYQLLANRIQQQKNEIAMSLSPLYYLLKDMKDIERYRSTSSGHKIMAFTSQFEPRVPVTDLSNVDRFLLAMQAHSELEREVQRLGHLVQQQIEDNYYRPFKRRGAKTLSRALEDMGLDQGDKAIQKQANPAVPPPMTCVTFILTVMKRSRNTSIGKGWFWAIGKGEDAEATLQRTRTVSPEKGWFWAAIKAQDAEGRPPPWMLLGTGSVSPSPFPRPLPPSF